MNNQILIIDDNHKLCRTLARSLQERGFTCHYSINSQDAYTIYLQEPIGVVILDIKLGDENGIEVLKNLRSYKNNTQIIMLTAYGSIETAVECLKFGAFDYIQKPIKIEKLLPIVSNAMKIFKLSDENLKIRNKLVEKYAPIISQDPKTLNLLERARKFAAFDFPVLITGESGTGKELLADFIHINSKRAAMEMQKINCASISQSLLDNELFGHEKGAYTGADARYKGFFEQAHSSSLFLDEIGDMHLSTQAKILRGIQQNVIRRIGGKEEIEVNVRFIAATNKMIDSMVEDKLFREDLYYRLSTGIFHLPSLRERKNDIQHLVNFFLNDFCQSTKREVVLDDRVMDIFYNYDWPGNIRELKNLINYMCAVSTGKVLSIDFLPPYFRTKQDKKVSNTSINNVEKNLIISVLKKENCNKTRAAEILGISRTTLYAKMKKYNVILKKEL